jgi:hypothetical protein
VVEIAQDLPVIPRLPWCAHRAIQSLQTSFPVYHRTALFRKSEGWQEGGRMFGCFIRQNIHENERGEVGEQLG